MKIRVTRPSFIQATQWVRKDTGNANIWILSIDDNGEGTLSSVSPTGFLLAPFTIQGVDTPRKLSVRLDGASLLNALTVIKTKNEETPLHLTFEFTGQQVTNVTILDGKSRFRIPVLGGSRRTLPEFTMIGHVDGKEFMSLLKGAHEITDTQNTARPYFSVIFLKTQADKLVATSALANTTFQGECGFTPLEGYQDNMVFNVPESAVKLWAPEGYTELLYVPSTGAFGVRTEEGNITIVNVVSTNVPNIEANTKRHVAVPKNSVILPRAAVLSAIGVAKQASRSESSVLFKIADDTLFVADREQNTVIEVPVTGVNTLTEDEFSLNILVSTRLFKAAKTEKVLFVFGGMNCYIQPIEKQEPVEDTIVCGKLAKH